MFTKLLPWLGCLAVAISFVIFTGEFRIGLGIALMMFGGACWLMAVDRSS